LVRLISDKSSLQKQLATIKSANMWYTGAVALGNYASRTTPPIIPQVALLAYMEYADFFKRLMAIYGADNDEKTMKVFLRFDEDYRLSLARTCAPQDMLWDVRSYSKFTDLQIRLVEIGNRKLHAMSTQLNQMKAELTSMKTQIAELKKKQPNKKTGGGGGGEDGLSLTDRLKKLVSPGGAKAKQDHIFKDGKKACMRFNSKGGCSAKNCQFSHHCVACEDTAHGIAGHE
jgi:hypothetical protein